MAKSRQSLSRRGLVGLASASAIAVTLVGGAQAGELAFGPVQQVNLKASTIVVLGQTFHVGSTTLVSSQARYPAAISLSSLSPGTLVSVIGAESAKGKAQVQSVLASATLNSPGATQLFVAGVVTSVSRTGRITVGNLTVDVNQTLTADGTLPAVGSFVNIVGTQPVSNGLFVASTSTRTQGIGGTGSTGIGGTGSAGIGGTGSAGIGGTGSAGIGGTGSAGIGGTGSAGIGGTGSAGIGGTGSAGIGGTGLN